MSRTAKTSCQAETKPTSPVSNSSCPCWDKETNQSRPNQPCQSIRSLSLISNMFTSTSTPMSTSGSIDGDQSKLLFVQNAAKREHHQQLLNTSLFEYSTNSKCMGKQSSRVEYSAMIYDSLSSNGLSISNGTQLMQNTTSLQLAHSMKASCVRRLKFDFNLF